MRELTTGRYPTLSDPDATLDIPAVRPSQGALRAEKGRSIRQNTPIFCTPIPLPESVRATLTVLTGLQAGQLWTIGGAPVTIGRATDADLMVDDAGVSRRHARITHTPAGLFSLEDLGSTNGTFLGTVRVGVGLLEPGNILQLGPHLRLRFAVVDSTEEALYRQLYESSVRDPLTQVYNRRHMADRLHAEIARTRRADGEMSVLMIDVDALKRVNDSLGHVAGDQALCAVASRVLHTLRVEDLLARYGGDEFVVLAVGTDRCDAELLAERVRGAVEALRVTAGGADVRLTTSIGVASLMEVAADEEPLAALLSLADARMYTAKASGKNRVCAEGLTPEPSSISTR